MKIIQKLSLIALLGFLSLCDGYTQTVISGKIIDASSKEPLAFANITLVGKTYGTTSNESGDFTFIVQASDSLDSLVVHYIGYQPFKKLLSELTSPVTIALNSQGINLDEVIVRPKPPTYYLKQAIKARTKNYAHNPFTSTAYYREAFFENDLPIFFQEAAVQTYYPKFIDTAQTNQHRILLQREPDVLSNLEFMRKKVDKRRAKAKRKAKRKGEEYDETSTKEILSAIFNGPDVVIDSDIMHNIDSYLDSNMFKKFEYSFGMPTTYEGRPVLVIDFKSRKKVEGAFYEGSIYLDDATLALVKEKVKGEFKIPVLLEPVLFMLGIGISDIYFDADVNYTHRSGVWYPNFTLFEIEMKLEEKHLFKANDISDIYMNIGYLVNQLNLTSSNPIPDEYRFDKTKPMKEQVHPIPNVTWQTINKIR